jgi:uncharacterized protein
LITTRSPRDNPPSPDAAAKPPRVHRHPLWKRRLASVSRWLHIYLSMTSFAILLFFAATGLTLNHPDWFAAQQKTVQSQGVLDARWVKGNVDKLQVVEFLRRKEGLHGAVDDFRIEDSQCSVSFKGPGYKADVVIDRAAGSYDVTTTYAGFVAILNDLHKGRDTGRTWSKIIDISALLMTAVSLSGLILIFYLHKRRLPGLMLLAAGCLLAYLIYAIWVP